MDFSILVRLLPAVAAGVVVAMRVDPARPLRVSEAADEVIRVLVASLLGGRLVWLLLGGPDVWRTALGTAVLVRAGVETGAGILVAGWWLSRQSEERDWRAMAAVPAGLAGIAVWQGLCAAEGVCGGIPVGWGVVFDGRAVAAFPAAWVEAACCLLLLAIAWRRREEQRDLWLVGAAYAAIRVALGFARPALVGRPTRDQLFFAVIFGVCLWLARGGRKAEEVRA